MNQQQVKYLKERIEQIYTVKCAAIKTKFMPAEPLLTWEDMQSQIKSGKAKLKASVRSYTDLKDAFTYEGESKQKELKTKADKKIAEETSKLATAKSKVIDELLLGDASEALNKLAQFEAIKV